MGAPAHTTLSVQRFLTHMPHSPYSPDLGRETFVCFPRIFEEKKFLKGKHFAIVEEGKRKTTEAPKGIKIDEFKNCFEQWKKVLCIASNGGLFGDDWSLNM